MFGLGLATKIYVAVEGVDMRKGFEGLYGLVRDQFGADPLSGHLFLFSNRTRTRLKALVWDGSGLVGAPHQLLQPAAAQFPSTFLPPLLSPTLSTRPHPVLGTGPSNVSVHERSVAGKTQAGSKITQK